MSTNTLNIEGGLYIQFWTYTLLYFRFYYYCFVMSIPTFFLFALILHLECKNVNLIYGRFCYKNVCRYGLHSLILNTSRGSTRISEPLSLISTSNVHNDKYIYYYEYLLHLFYRVLFGFLLIAIYPFPYD